MNERWRQADILSVWQLGLIACRTRIRCKPRQFRSVLVQTILFRNLRKLSSSSYEPSHAMQQFNSIDNSIKFYCWVFWSEILVKKIKFQSWVFLCQKYIKINGETLCDGGAQLCSGNNRVYRQNIGNYPMGGTVSELTWRFHQLSQAFFLLLKILKLILRDRI